MAFEAKNIHYVKWMDNKPVQMLSNFLSMHPLRNVKRRKKGSSTSEVVSCPAIVKQYNSSMGGVDIMDQKKATYQFDHRSKYKYYFRVVHDLIDIAINNAHIIFGQFQENEKDGVDAKTFRRIIARSLIANFSNRKRTLQMAPILNEKRSKYTNNSCGTTQYTMCKDVKRRRCKLCTRRKLQNLTKNKCVECNIHLCYVNVVIVFKCTIVTHLKSFTC